MRRAYPSAPAGSLRRHFQKDFDNYGRALRLINTVTKWMTFQAWGDCEPSMYSIQTGLGPLNPFATLHRNPINTSRKVLQRNHRRIQPLHGYQVLSRLLPTNSRNF